MAAVPNLNKTRLYLGLFLFFVSALLAISVHGIDSESLTETTELTNQDEITVLNNLVEMDTHLFEELVAGSDERRVRHDETWLIFFDSPTCKRCNEVYDVFLDLSNVPDFVSEFKLAHIMCPKANSVCFRLGIRGYPTISVL